MVNPKPTRDVYIPVAVDAERTIDGHNMSRVTYFVITTDAPGSIWPIQLPPSAPLQGVGALGVMGVVYRALRAPDESAVGRESELFSDPADIAALFALEDETSPLSIQLEDVWIPTDWLRTASTWGSENSNQVTERHPERGFVYRIGLPTFQAAYRYTAGDIDLSSLLEAGGPEEMFFSPIETESVRAWAQNQINQARSSFPNKELKLRYRQAEKADA